mmetsp:Transcript_34429/g.97817  ORF Transcript_34429/g.97817 Transcript_34429/m.97817 type:complete len:302 (+) Transcript_34429:54-959(+)
MARTAAAALALLASCGYAAASPALDFDDECAASGDCALNALQMRGSKLVDPEAGPDVEMEGGYFFDPPSGWIDEDEKTLQEIEATAPEVAGGDLDSIVEYHHHGHHGHHDHNNQISKVDENKKTYCSMNPKVQNCFLYSVCHGRSYCVMWGYLVMPGRPCTGTEEINGGNARDYDFLFNVAKNQCNGDHCVLIVNPMHHRTQEQLHIHFRKYSGDGDNMKAALEKATCSGGGWTSFHTHGCGSGKAKFFRGFPKVFSEVAEVYGGGNLASVGIQVWPGSCGRTGYIVQTTTHCSIEHSITR